MHNGNFNKNFKSVETANLGKIVNKLKILDYSNGFPEFSEEDYEIIDDIRNIRNYWRHQCYIDYIYPR